MCASLLFRMIQTCLSLVHRNILISVVCNFLSCRNRLDNIRELCCMYLPPSVAIIIATAPVSSILQVCKSLIYNMVHNDVKDIISCVHFIAPMLCKSQLALR